MSRIKAPTRRCNCASPRSRGRRGSALPLALALVVAMTLLVAAMQMAVVRQLGVSATERDYERALQMAETGINAYLNMKANGGMVATGTPIAAPSWWPSVYTFDNAQPVPTIAQFKAGV